MLDLTDAQLNRHQGKATLDHYVPTRTVTMNIGKNMKELGLSNLDEGGVKQGIHSAEHIISCESSLPPLSMGIQEKWVSPKDMHQSVWRNTIHNSPKPEVPKVWINSRMPSSAHRSSALSWCLCLNITQAQHLAWFTSGISIKSQTPCRPPLDTL